MSSKNKSDIGFLKKFLVLSTAAFANFFKSTTKVAPYALLATKPVTDLVKKRKLIKNPMFLFVKAIIGKWVLIMTMAGITVVYYVFQSLSSAGVISNFERTLTSAIHDTKAVAIHCVPQILNLGDFWDCLKDPPRYVPSDYQRELREELIEHSRSYYIPEPDPKDPYEE